MRKFFRASAALAVIAALMLSLSVLTGSAAGSTVLAVSNKSPKVGDTVTVTVTIRADESMYATEAYLSFDSSVLRFESGSSANLVDGRVKIVGTPGGSSDPQSYHLQFTAIAAGSCPLSVENVMYVGTEETAVTGAGYTLGVTQDAQDAPAAGNDANLTALKVSSGSLSPAFSANRTSYTVTVDNSVTKMTVSASAAADAKVSGAGNISLAVGDNKCAVTVTAADGVTKKTYTITIRRLEEDASSDEPAPADDSDALAVQIDGAGYHIMTDLSPLAVPAGFTLSSSSYSGIPVPAYTDDRAEFTLYGLTPDAGGTPDYYTYNAKTNVFEAVKYLNTPDRFFIFLTTDQELSAPEGFYEKTASVGDMLVEGFAYDDAALGDFAVIYCFVNGQYGYYRYDSREGTLQRCPEFRPVKQTAAESPTVERTGVLSRLSALSDRAKLVIFALLVAAVCAVALVVLLVIHALSGRRAADRAFDDEFDYGVDDAIPFHTVEELSDQDEADDRSAEPQAQQPPEQEEPDEEE